MKKTAFFCLVGTLFLAGCGINKPDFVVDPQKSAKIRIFRSDNPHFTPIAKGMKCFSRSGSQSSSNIITRLSTPNRLGMPLTDDIPDAFISSYDEFVIPSSQLIVFSGLYAADNMTCGPVGAIFLPETDKMYDARVTFKNARCRIRVREINVDSNGKVEAKEIPALPLISCNDYERLKKEKIME